MTLKVSLKNATGKKGSGTLLVGNIASEPISWDETGGSGTITFSVGAAAQTWDEFHPVLSRCGVMLIPSGEASQMDDREISYGFREISPNGQQLLQSEIFRISSAVAGGCQRSGHPPQMTKVTATNAATPATIRHLSGRRRHQAQVYHIPTCGFNMTSGSLSVRRT